MEYNEICVYLYDKAVIRQALLDISEIISDHLKEDTTIFIKRGWVKGSHLKVVYKSTLRYDIKSKLLRAIKEKIEEWRTISVIDVDYKQYELYAERIALIENFTGTYLPIKEQFLIETREYIFESKINPANQILDEVTKTKVLVFSLRYYEKLSYTEKELFTSKLLLILGDRISESDGGISMTYFSFKSHYEGFLMSLANFTEEKRKEIIEKMAPRTLEETNFIVKEFPVFIDQIYCNFEGLIEEEKLIFRFFKDQIELLKSRYTQSFIKGEVIISKEQTIKHYVNENKENLSSFHEIIAEKIDLEIFNTEEFIVGRLLVNWFYSLLPLFSISPLQKHKLCNIICLGVEKNNKKTFFELLDDLVLKLNQEK